MGTSTTSGFLLRGLAVASLAALLAACGNEDNGSAQGGGGERPPPQVSVVTTKTEDAEIVQDYAGRVRGSREVEARARVEGILQKRLYDEGQIVEKDDALFAIDPEPFALSLQASRAERDRAEAELQQAQREWNRVSRLYDQNAISERERDSSLSALELARASLSMANAKVDQQRLQLDYTDVVAPIGGVTSLEAHSEGSLVEPGALLARITQLDPVHVRFALPENDAGLQQRAREAMSQGNGGAHRRDATLILPGGQKYEREGHIDFTASTIDPQTGTVSARAIFPNPDNTVVPGQFVRVRMLLRTLEDVIVIPQQAIGENSQGARVFVVDGDGVAHARTVELGPIVKNLQVVTSGLEAGEKVIVNGQVAVQDGMTVNPQEASTGSSGAQNAEQEDAAGEGN